MPGELEYDNVLLDVKGLKKHFKTKKEKVSKEQQSSTLVKAVDGVSFKVKKGETLGIVGESGCGKSTMGRAILQLVKPSEGEVWFQGNDISKLKSKQMNKMRKDIQIIFQDPYSSLNPRMTVGAMLAEIVRTHKITPKSEEKEYVKNLLEQVGLRPEHYWHYPHEFSGGQRQRISIARALAVKPKLIICDEAVSALDVSVQAQVLNLLEKLKQKYNLTYIFISHDLSVVKHVSDRVGVMYLGKIVELAGKDVIYDSPSHPYTKALFSAIPDISNEKKQEEVFLKGDIPSPLNIPSGCRFHTRCPIAVESCKRMEPSLENKQRNHYVACNLVDKVSSDNELNRII